MLIDSIKEKIAYITFGESDSGVIAAAITEAGNLYCWGSNEYGQAGNGTVSEAQTKPVKVTFPENTVIYSVSIGGRHVVALTENGDLYAWGDNSYGQLGNGTTTDSTTPIKILSGVSSAKAFTFETDVIMDNRDFYCWGSSWGYGSKEDIYEPASTPVLSNVASIEASGAVITEDGDLYRWGTNFCGTLGDGTHTNRTTPYKVNVSNVVSMSDGVCAAAAGKESLSYYHLHKFDKRYKELIEQAREQNPVSVARQKKRGRKKKGKILALVERLDNYKASVCLFIHNFSVPFDNNQAERDLRMIKVKTKVSGCFRSEEGARNYLKIMSYVGTAHKQNLNAYEAIKNAISGNPLYIFSEGSE